MTEKKASGRNAGLLSRTGRTSMVLFCILFTFLSPASLRIGAAETVLPNGTPSSWADAGIRHLKTVMPLPENYLDGYQATMTRRDFTELLVRLYLQISGLDPSSLPMSNDAVFPDTTDEWVRKGHALGLVAGFPDGRFLPEGTLTREQIASMTIRMLEKTGIAFDETRLSAVLFPDEAQAGGWAIRSLRQCVRNGILKGDTRGRLLPKNLLTQEQALVIADNVLANLELLPMQAGPASEGESNTGPGPNASTITLSLKWTKGGAYSSWAETGWYSTPALLDINGDGTREIIASAYSVAALDAATGKTIWRAPSGHAAGSNASSVGRTWPDILVADVDKDGKDEIVTAHGEGYVSVYKSDGSLKAGWPKRPVKSELRSLKVADLDLDGTMEIIVGAAIGSKTNTWVYEHDGSLRKGWPQTSTDAGYAWGVYNDNIAVGDLSGDARLEIIVPSDVHYICAYRDDGTPLAANPLYGTKKWGAVGVWEDLAVEIRGWGEGSGPRTERYRPNFAHGPALVADVDHNGTREVIAVGNVYDCEGTYTSKYTGLFLFNGDRSRFKTAAYNWQSVPRDTGAPLSEDYDEIENCQPNPVSIDLNGDKADEILFSSYDGRIHCYSLDGKEHGNWPYDLVSNQPAWGGKKAGIVFASAPVAADLNGDAVPEIIVSTWTNKTSGINGSVLVLDASGNRKAEMEIPNPFQVAAGNGALASPLVADTDGDGLQEIIINTVNGGFMAFDVTLR